MKTLYVSDLDGTLLDPGAQVSAFSIIQLNRMIEQGLHFSVATARTAASVRKILQLVEIDVPVILMNGVLVYDLRRDRYEHVVFLQQEAIETVVQAQRRYGVTGFVYSIQRNQMIAYYEALRSNAMRHFYTRRRQKYYKIFQQVDSFLDVKQNHLVYFTMINTYEKLYPIHEELKDNPLLSVTFYEDIYSDDLWYLEIFDHKASKYHAVQYLRAAYGYERVVGFGDNLNDIPLLQACDVKCAVDNAKQPLKDMADVVVASHAQDGVVRYILQQWQKRT